MKPTEADATFAVAVALLRVGTVRAGSFLARRLDDGSFACSGEAWNMHQTEEWIERDRVRFGADRSAFGAALALVRAVGPWKAARAAALAQAIPRR